MPSGPFRDLAELREAVTGCRLCPRLVEYRERLPKRASFRDQEYWRLPVSGFGDPDAWLMVLGLAPAAHGGNRTGRVFTGDESARFLTRVLYKCGFANQPTSVSRDDGLRFTGCYVTAAVKCVPPGNKPTPKEFDNCSRYLEAEFSLLGRLTAVVALGGMASKAYVDYLRSRGVKMGRTEFRHGARYPVDSMPTLYCAYHPSPRNTYTGKLTEEMLRRVFQAAKRDRGRGRVDRD